MGEDKRARVLSSREWMRWVMTKGAKMGLKPLICPKKGPAVPVQFSAVPVQVALCHFLY